MDNTEKTRREWFENYLSHVNQGIVRAPYEGALYTCPCCGYPTLQERGGYEICVLCNWEDDGQDDPCADEIWGGPNGRYSLSEARENFKKNLIKFDSINPRIGGADSDLEKQAKMSIIEAFGKMQGESNPELLRGLWDQVRKGRQILSQEVSRKVREYEKLHKK